jgi:hypothetical protein
MLRAGFGLLALLISVFIMVWVFSWYTASNLPAYKNATNQANMIAGNSRSNVIGQAGTPVLADSKFAPVESNGNLTGVQVTVMPTTNGLYEFFGLAPGDVVREIGPFKVGDTTLTDFGTTRDWIQEAMQRQMPIVVERGGRTFKLPDEKASLPAPAATPAPTGIAAAPGTTAPSTPPTAEAQQQQPQAAPPAPAQPARNGYGAADELRQQIQRAQNRGD